MLGKLLARLEEEMRDEVERRLGRDATSQEQEYCEEDVIKEVLKHLRIRRE